MNLKSSQKLTGLVLHSSLGNHNIKCLNPKPGVWDFCRESLARAVTQRYTHTHICRVAFSFPNKDVYSHFRCPRVLSCHLLRMRNMISNLLGEQPGHPTASQVAPINYVWLTKSQPSISLFFRQNIIQSQHLISDHPSSLVSGEVKGQSSLCEGWGCRADPCSSAWHGHICLSPKLLSPWRQGLFNNSRHWLPGAQEIFQSIWGYV